MSSAPAQHAGIASAVNNDLARFGGLLAAVTITNPRPDLGTAEAPVPGECLHCGLDAPPLTTSASPAQG